MDSLLYRAIAKKGIGRILIVEDERIVALDLATTLTRIGYSVVGSVATGEYAIEKARALKPQLILMDIHLRGALDGIDAAAEIRRQLDIPILFLTAHCDDETLQRAKTTEPFGYLVKPYKPAELRCAIEIALHKHEIEAKLREREEWLATTLRNIGDAVVTTDVERRVKFLNPVAEALTGWTSDEAVGKRVEEILSLVSDQTHAPIESPIRQALEARQRSSRPSPTKLISRSGAEVLIEDSAAPVLDHRQQVVGGIMILRDVGEHCRAQDEVNRLNAQLEQRVLERTAELQAANREIVEFAHLVVRDLRDSLHSTDGFSELLIERHADKLGAEGLRQLHRVREAASHMRRLIDDLLRLGQAARMPLLRKEVDLSQIATEICARLTEESPQRRVRWSVQSAVKVYGDVGLLTMLLRNLLENAWKFTSKRLADAEVSFGATVDSDGQPVCYVRDNGVGLDMTQSDKLFGAFQRLTSSELSGNGIGLALSQRIVRRHAGDIWAQGQANQGATFFFKIPPATEA